VPDLDAAARSGPANNQAAEHTRKAQTPPVAAKGRTPVRKSLTVAAQEKTQEKPFRCCPDFRSGAGFQLALSRQDGVA